MNKITNTHKSYKRNILVFQLVLIHYLVTRYSLLATRANTTDKTSYFSRFSIAD